MQNAENKEDIIVSKPVLEVFAIASEYCLFIDKMANYEQVEAFSFLQKILSALYLKGCLFPTIEVEDDTANERFVTEGVRNLATEIVAIYGGQRLLFNR